MVIDFLLDGCLIPLKNFWILTANNTDASISGIGCPFPSFSAKAGFLPLFIIVVTSVLMRSGNSSNYSQQYILKSWKTVKKWFIILVSQGAQSSGWSLVSVRKSVAPAYLARCPCLKQDAHGYSEPGGGTFSKEPRYPSLWKGCHGKCASHNSEGTLHALWFTGYLRIFIPTISHQMLVGRL